MLRFSAQSATRLPGRVFGGIFRANSNLVKKQRCRYFSQKSPSVPVPLRSRKTVAADSQSPFARPVLIPAENSQSSQEMISKDVESKLASTKTLDQLHWIPPAGKPKTSAEVELESWQKLPPPPDRAFNSFVPTDRLAEQEYIKQVGKALPPDDIFQIPVKLSQPWFGKLLKFYCAALAVVIAIFGDWDGLNAGEAHCFQPLQRWVREKKEQFWSMDPDKMQARIQEELTRGLKSS